MAYIIGYAPDKTAVIDDLEAAVQDPEDGVRSNAMRSLTAISSEPQAKNDPKQVRISLNLARRNVEFRDVVGPEQGGDGSVESHRQPAGKTS